ncbi:Nif3-like dinuclear metal center hexameric protein [Bacillus sp. FJAT-50079]|uniref:Nif3-like dinuclear metal center hexameric protein n=1 Tax=Bacillus sp. FJAT-50079 TaxID=2833577 RepID=UPI001BC92429|nr:Nif3-like dinuclear metal center hexameric protein [Bacillus sp. FJAT-50079]MBS4209342.1 Nif3-like dinuclear metal center hexameric protein [Bacillus sp. FJAT-50079]
MTILVRDVVDQLIKPAQKLEPTVDRLIAGNEQVPIKGMATTFIATQHVIQQAIDLGVNLLITHEGIYYRHHEQWLNDPVYEEKKCLIKNADIAIFRFHDYVHLYKPDGIMAGLLYKLNWKAYVEKHCDIVSVLSLPAISLDEMTQYIKARLNLSYVRVVGDLSMMCERVGLLVGYRGGGDLAIPLFQQNQLDVMIIGEGPEWETPEYVRDAVQQGRGKALIVLGHAESEKHGMEYIAIKLQMLYPNIPVHFIDDKPVFQFV